MSRKRFSVEEKAEIVLLALQDSRTMKEEWLMWKELRNIDELQETIDEFVEWYNTNREHSSLDYKVPSEVHFATSSGDRPRTERSQIK